MDGEAYLRRLIAQRLREISDQPDAARGFTVSFLQQEVQGAANALVASKILSPQGARELRAELHQLLIDRGFIQEVRISTEARTELVAERVGPPPEEWSLALQPSPVPELERVLPVVRDLGELPSGERLVLVSLELWSDHLTLRWAVRSRAEERWERGRYRRLFPGPGEWEAWDDAGTTYRPAGGGGSGGEHWVSLRHAFHPAPPPEAYEITFLLKDPERGELVRTTIPLR